jgi:hypothetical protein
VIDVGTVFDFFVYRDASCSYQLLGDGKCCICDSYVRPHELVRICDECHFGTSSQNKCMLCGLPASSAGLTDAYYCQECCIMQRDVKFL